MILLGNMETFQACRDPIGRDMWEKLLGMLDETKSIFSGFPALCSVHNRSFLMTSKADFEKMSPDGGCDADCGALLNCGKHSCPKKCHRGDHDKDVCQAPVEAYCSANQHALHLPCSQIANKTQSSIDALCELCKIIKKKQNDEKKAAAGAAQRHAKRISELQAKQRELQELQDKLKEVDEREKLEIQKMKLEEERKQLEAEFERKKAQSAAKLAQLKAEIESEKKQQEPPKNDRQPNNANSGGNNQNSGGSGAPSNSPNNSSPNSSNTPNAPVPSTSDSAFMKKELKDQIAEIKSCPRQLTDLCGLSFPLVQALFQSSEPLPVTLKHGLTLVGERKWTDALKFFSRLDDANSPDKQTLSEACRSQMDDPTLQDDLEKRDFMKIEGHPMLYAFCAALCCSTMSGHFKTNLAYAFGLAFLVKGEENAKEIPKELVESVRKLLIKLRNEALKTAAAKPKDLAQEVANRWQVERTRFKASNTGMDDLLGLSALGKIKEQFLKIYHSITTAKRQGRKLTDFRLNICLCGNPGTGKTTVARIYAKFLAELGALSGAGFEETTGAKLSHEGVDGLKKLLAGLVGQGGGLLFIDEAYQLNSTGDSSSGGLPVSSGQGRQVLDYLLTETENNLGKLVVAFAGYQTKIEKLMGYNEGLPSRFPYSFVFEDYTDDQLHDIFKITVKNSAGLKPFDVEEGLNGQPVRILIRRIARGRGAIGFGNARAVKNAFQHVMENQAMRLAAEREAGRVPDDFEITRSDLLGPDPVDALQTSKAWAELQTMIGLGAVKASLQQLFDLIKTNYELEKLEKPLRNVTLNRLFLGNPGTGKTTVAEIFGRVLKDLGLLTSGEVVLKKPSDFIGQYLGQSEAQTRQILQASVGKVLVIDEAYGLYPGEKFNDPYKNGVIDAIVGEVQNVPGEDRCVLMLGYRKQMEEMMRNSNPGLARRFALEQAFNFEDFNDVELIQILNLKLKKDGLSCSIDAQLAAANVLGLERRKPNFGNGGAVVNLISQAFMRQQDRLKDLSAAERAAISTLEPQDFDPDWTPAFGGATLNVAIEDFFKDLVGCDNIIDQMNMYKTTIRVMMAQGRNPNEEIPMNFLFQGPPGTGKTTVARRVGQMFKAFGMLATDDVVEASATDFIGKYIGSTQHRTRQMLEKALGKVLFLDEAYRLDPQKNSGHFCQEALDEMVDALTKPEFKGKLVVILAGYREDLAGLLTANAGLASRFSGRVDFNSFSKEDCVDLFEKKLALKCWTIDSPDAAVLLDLFDQLRRTSGWGNGRDIGNLVDKVVQKASGSTDESKIRAGEAIPIPFSLVEQVLRDDLQHRKSQSEMMAKRKQSHRKINMEPPAPSQDDRPPEIQLAQNTANLQNNEKPENSGSSEEAELGLGPRDPGVSDEIWQKLIEAAREELRRNKEYEDQKKALEELERQFAEEQRLAEEARLEAERLAAEREEEERKAREEAERAEEARLAELRRQQEIERLKREEALRKAREEAERRRQEAERLERERQRRQAELQRIERERQREAANQQKLRSMGVCPAGFRWLREGNGYRCAGGSHYVHMSQLG